MVTAMISPRIPKTPSTPNRPPLGPSEPNAAPIPRRPRAKEITSRYLSPSPSSSSTNPRPKTPSPFPQNSLPKRPNSSTTTRSLSVSFQPESFSFQTSRTKPTSPNPIRNPTPDRRKPQTPTPIKNQPETRRRWPSAKTQQPNPLTRSLDCSSGKKDPILAAVRLFRRSMVLDGGWDSDSLSSVRGRPAPRGVSIPARFLKDGSTPAKKSSPVDTPIRPSSPLKRIGKKGESCRAEEAHLLRLMYNQYLQWRCVNARTEAAISAQRLNAEKSLYDAWMTTTKMRDSVTIKRIKLQLLLQNLKFTSIIMGQVTYLDKWSQMAGEHNNYLSGITEALKASTLRLPVVGGARADIHEVQNAVGSAVDVMQAMGTSICSQLSKVEGMSSLVSELARAAEHERNLLDQSKNLLANVAAMHVKQCSLQGHVLQLTRKPTLVRP